MAMFQKANATRTFANWLQAKSLRKMGLLSSAYPTATASTPSTLWSIASASTV